MFLTLFDIHNSIPVSGKEKFFAGTVPINKKLFGGTLPTNKKLFFGRVPMKDSIYTNESVFAATVDSK